MASTKKEEKLPTIKSEEKEWPTIKTEPESDSEPEWKKTTRRRNFAIIFVMGRPQSGKSTICRHLADRYNLMHISKDTMESVSRPRPIPRDPTYLEYNCAALHRVIQEAMMLDESCKGVLVEKFPESEAQRRRFEQWSQGDEWPLLHGLKPDLVFWLECSYNEGIKRFFRLFPNRDLDSEPRESHLSPNSHIVKGKYRDRGILCHVDTKSSIDETIEQLEGRLADSRLWHKAVISPETADSWFVV